MQAAIRVDEFEDCFGLSCFVCLAWVVELTVQNVGYDAFGVQLAADRVGFHANAN